MDGILRTLLGGMGAPPNLQAMFPEPTEFKQLLKCFPVAMSPQEAHFDLEHGDKVVLPPSALHMLSRMQVSFPMMFHVTNQRSTLSCHCGVQEFVADEGKVYMPYWMMQHLGVSTGDLVQFENVDLPKGTFVKFKAHEKRFAELSNPRAVLERALRAFGTLSESQTIPIRYDNTTFLLDVVELKPSRAVCVVETDLNVDFDVPHDMEREERRLARTPQQGPGADPQGAGLAYNATDESSFATAPGSSPGGMSYFEKLAAAGSSGRRLKDPAAAAAAAAATSSSSAAAAAADEPPPANRRQSSLAQAPLQRVTEVKGNFQYIYEVDGSGAKRLIRRVPAPRKSLAAAASPASGGAAAAASGSSAAAVPLSQRKGGYSLK